MDAQKGEVAVTAEWQVFCDGARDSGRHYSEIAWPRQRKLAVWCDEHGCGFEFNLDRLADAIAQRHDRVHLRLDEKCTEPHAPYREYGVLATATLLLRYTNGTP